jgi:photosystem II stability/assembly factor-like uncharacterized protein
MMKNNLVIIAATILLVLSASTEAFGQSSHANSICCFAESGTKLFAGTDSGVYLTTNSGASWKAINYPPGLRGYSAMSIAMIGRILVCDFSGPIRDKKVYGGVFRTDNLGASWTEAKITAAYNFFTAIAVSGTNLIAGTYGDGVFLSTDSGTTWSVANTGLPNRIVYTFVVFGTSSSAMVFAGTDSGFFRSTDNGTSWAPVNTGLANTDVHSLLVFGSNIFAAGGRGIVYRSTNNGESWTAASTGLPGYDIDALAVSDTNLFAGIYGVGVDRSTDSGKSWSPANAGKLSFDGINALAVSGKNLLAGTTSGLFLSSNNGEDWTACNLPIHMKTKQELKDEATAAKSAAEEAKRAAAVRKKADRVLTPDVIDGLANQFLDFSEATKLAFNLNMSLGTNFDGRKLWAAANGGGIKSYFEQQFQSVSAFSEMQLGILSRTLGLTYDQSRALQGK